MINLSLKKNLSNLRNRRQVLWSIESRKVKGKKN